MDAMDGETALHLAALCDHLLMIESLCTEAAASVNVDIQDSVSVNNFVLFIQGNLEYQHSFKET